MPKLSQKHSPTPRIQLRLAREAVGWAQEELARQLGTGQVSVSRWETGETTPSPYFRKRLCQILGKNPEDLDLESPNRENMLSIEQANESIAIIDPLIPPAPLALIGRETELQEIKMRLCQEQQVALTTVKGLPGVGKTTLAVALAHDPQIRSEFPDGVLWAGLGIKPDLIGLLRRWGALLGLRDASLDSGNLDILARTVRSTIGNRRMLLIIDDAWKIDDVLVFKIGGPHCTHLITTRFPHIATRLGPNEPVFLQELSEKRSLELLHLLAPQVVEHEAAKARMLVQSVGGLPLALTITGNYLRIQTASGQPRRIQAALEHLESTTTRFHLSEPQGPAERHPSLPAEQLFSLEAVIALSDQHLSDVSRKALYALSILPNKPDTFSESAALAICACPTEVLDTLIDTGLLESCSDGRYMVHQTIADYAHMHLTGIQAHERLIQYAHEFVEEHKTDYEQLDMESGTIIAALEAAYEIGKKKEIVRNTSAFTPFLLMRGNYSLAERHLERAYNTAVEIGDRYGIANTLLYKGLIEQKHGNYSQSETYLQKGLILAREVNTPAHIDALLYLGQTEQKKGNYDPAKTYFQESLLLARQVNDSERISAILADLGWITMKRGEYTQAEVYLQEGLTLARQFEHRERICGLLRVLSTGASSRGNYQQSETYMLEGLALARQIGDREQTCGFLINLGVMDAEQGNYPQAEIYFQEGLVLARQMGYSEQIVVLLGNLGDIESELGAYTKAESYFQQALTLARQIGNPEWMSAVLINLGVTTRRQCHYQQAEAYLQEGLHIAKKIGLPLMIANTLYEYGTLYLDQNNIPLAEKAFQDALTTISEGEQDLAALARYGLARTALAQGNHDDAQRLGEASLTILENIGHRNALEVRAWVTSLNGTNGIQKDPIAFRHTWIDKYRSSTSSDSSQDVTPTPPQMDAVIYIDALLYLGQTEQKKGNYNQAETHFQEGLVLARQVNDKERISTLLADLGSVALKRGEYAKAEVYLQEGLTLARQIGHHGSICGLLRGLSTVADNQGNYQQSETYMLEGLALARQIGDCEQICSLLLNLGATLAEQGSYQRAKAHFREGLTVARELGLREWIAVLLGNLGDIEIEVENYTQADAYFQEGLALARQIDHREWTSALLINLGVSIRKQKRYVEAETYLLEGLQLAQQIARPQMIASALCECGSVYLAQNKIEQARKAFQEMLTIIPDGEQDLVALAQHGLARTAMAQGNRTEAQQLGAASLTILESIGHRYAPEVKQWLISTSD